MVAIKIRVATHIKAREFKIKKREEEERNKEGIRVGTRHAENRDGHFKASRKEDM